MRGARFTSCRSVVIAIIVIASVITVIVILLQAPADSRPYALATRTGQTRSYSGSL